MTETNIDLPRINGHQVKSRSSSSRTRQGSDSGVLSCSIASMMHEFRSHRMAETFHHGIVLAVRAPTHARRQTMTGQQLAVRGGGVLGPTVRMYNTAGRWRSTAMVSVPATDSWVRRLPIPQAMTRRE